MRLDRNTLEYREKAAARMREWRKNNPQTHRDREKARYWKKKAEDPVALREKSRIAMAEWRKNTPKNLEPIKKLGPAKTPTKFGLPQSSTATGWVWMSTGSCSPHKAVSAQFALQIVSVDGAWTTSTRQAR